MARGSWTRGAVRLTGAGAVALGGCLGQPAVPRGYASTVGGPPGAQTVSYLVPDATPKMMPPTPPDAPPAKAPRPFELPQGLPGADGTPVRSPSGCGWCARRTPNSSRPASWRSRPANPPRARGRTVEAHTDISTARNRIIQAQTNLRLQKLNRVPDMTTNYVAQHDNALGLRQYNLQLGFPVPVWGRNQSNIRSVESQISSNIALTATENDLLGWLADALGRDEANRVSVANYREKVLPALTNAYQGLIRRYQQEPH